MSLNNYENAITDYAVSHNFRNLYLHNVLTKD